MDGDRDATRTDGSTVRVSDALRHEEAPGSPREWLREAELWLLVDLHRWALVALLSALVFLSVTLAVLLGPASVRDYLLRGTALAKGYVELQTIDVTVITIVLTINQLVLSSELGSIGRHRSRLDEVLEDRERAEALVDAPTTPTDPDHYLRTLIAATRERADRLEAAFAEESDDELREGVSEYVADVTAETDRVAAALAGRRFGSIELVGAAMHLTTAEKIHAIRDVHERHADALDADQRAAIEELLELLQLYTVAREYFRAAYVQWEFIDFSRAVLYLGLPAVVVAHLTIGLIDGGAFTGRLFGVPTLFWYESLAFTVVLVPVAVVVSYAARLSMLAKASIFVAPFSPEREGGHWEE